ncbi:MAG: hypothetical protein ACK56F_11560, partial [bacterium]
MLALPMMSHREQTSPHVLQAYQEILYLSCEKNFTEGRRLFNVHVQLYSRTYSRVGIAMGTI